MDDKEYVYELIIDGKCITNKDYDFVDSFAICSNRKKANQLRDRYLQILKKDGYETTHNKTVPYEPGHIYYMRRGIEKWIITTFIVEHSLDELWIEEELKEEEEEDE